MTLIIFKKELRETHLENEKSSNTDNHVPTETHLEKEKSSSTDNQVPGPSSIGKAARRGKFVTTKSKKASLASFHGLKRLRNLRLLCVLFVIQSLELMQVVWHRLDFTMRKSQVTSRKNYQILIREHL